jgi:large subunit ribosomal protein L33
MPQTKFVLKCQTCKDNNYVKTKNKTNVTTALTLNKFCPKCRQHTPHAEARLRK